MKTLKHTLIALTLTLGAAAPAIAAPAAATPLTFVMSADKHTQTEASFTSKAEIVRFTGRTPNVTGQAKLKLTDLAKAAGEVDVDLQSLDTGVSLRNTHMKHFLEADKFPKAVFKFTGIKVNGNKLVANHSVSGVANGTMTIHGVTRKLVAPIDLVYLPEADKNYREGNWVQLSSEFKVKLADYGIELPKPVLGIKVADEVTVEVYGMAKAQ